jgi:ribosomal protein S18 acetylase RimI-like enzyme
MPLIALPEDLPQLAHGLEMIAVEHRGNGLSGALIREHLSQFAKTGTRSAEIQLMKDNVPAIIAYQKVGFTFKSEKSSELRIDTLRCQALANQSRKV